MMRRLRVGLSLLVLVGCGASEEEASDENVFDPLVEQVERAEDVQRILDEQAEELRRRVEEAEGR